mmetsp:Transcript_28432/g.27400  ORF Transcript_28432/g.27400 Transcript_28432/m.27400 type:complete len:94 (+) Transcript_28432:136-417(+)
MLKYLKGYGVGTHSDEIKDLIPHFLDKGLPELDAYLTSRLLQTEQAKNVSKAKLKENFPEIAPMQLWYADSEFNDQYTIKDELDEQIETRIKC